MSWATRIMEELAASPGGLTHGELRGALPGLSDGVLRLQLHQLRAKGVLRPSVSVRAGRAPLAQRADDMTPARRPVALRGAAALIVRRLLVGAVLADVDDMQDVLREAQHEARADVTLYGLLTQGVASPGWPLALAAGAEFTFED